MPRYRLSPWTPLRLAGLAAPIYLLALLIPAWYSAVSENDWPLSLVMFWVLGIENLLPFSLLVQYAVRQEQPWRRWLSLVLCVPAIRMVLFWVGSPDDDLLTGADLDLESLLQSVWERWITLVWFAVFWVLVFLQRRSQGEGGRHGQLEPPRWRPGVSTTFKDQDRNRSANPDERNRD